MVAEIRKRAKGEMGIEETADNPSGSESRVEDEIDRAADFPCLAVAG